MLLAEALSIFLCVDFVVVQNWARGLGSVAEALANFFENF